MMAREDVKLDILRLVARHDGEWSCYHVDCALSGTLPGCVGPFMAEIRELASAGLIEIRPTFALGDQGRYWLTETGRSAVADA
jgi:hypothetical protein